LFSVQMVTVELRPGISFGVTKVFNSLEAIQSAVIPLRDTSKNPQQTRCPGKRVDKTNEAQHVSPSRRTENENH